MIEQFYIHKQDLPLFGQVEQLIGIDEQQTVWWIPQDEASNLYQQYLAWLEAGNTPEPWEATNGPV